VVSALLMAVALGLVMRASPVEAAQVAYPPDAHLICGINGLIRVAPRLQAEISTAKIRATLTDCNGPTNASGVPVGPAIHSGKLRVFGAGTVDPTAPGFTGCNPAQMSWMPSGTWTIVWKAGANGKGKTLGTTSLTGMSFLVGHRVVDNTGTYYLQFGTAAGLDLHTGGPVAATGTFAGGSILANPSGFSIPVMLGNALCRTRPGQRTMTFVGGTGTLAAPESAAISIHP
jgi:hypothetical protein